MRLRKTIDTSGIALDPEALEGRLDLPEIFGRPGPFELEIGSGKGTFLAQEAAARRDVCFLGVEYMRKYCAYAADRLRRAGLDHCRTLATDAVELLRDHLPSDAFQVVHIYFPDPWPKARHNRRRLVRADVLPELERVVAPGGELRIVTDHPEYAEWIAEVMEQCTFPAIEYTPPVSARDGEMVGTNFERKYTVRDGRPFFPFARRKPAASGA